MDNTNTITAGSKSAKSNTRLFKMIILLAVLLTPVLFMVKHIDTDTYFILNLGRYTLENGFTTTDPFTMHEGLNYIFQQWLTGVIFYKIYQFAGYQGLIIMVAVESIIMVAIMYKLLMILSKNNFVVSALLSIAFSFGASCYMTTRPQIMSYIIILTFITLMEKYAETEKIRYLVPLPILSLAEINLHAATWPLLFVFSLPFIFSFNRLASIVNNIQFKKIPLLIFLAISFAVGFITPYGYKSMAYLFMSNGAKNSRIISELAAPEFMDPRSIVILISAALIIMITVIRYYKKKPFCVRYFLLCGGTLIMYAIALRNIVYCTIGLCLYGAVLLSDVKIPDKNKIINPKTMFKIFYILSLVLLAVEIYAAGNLKLEKNNMEESCGQIVEYLNEHTDEKNLYTDFGSGGYFEFYGFKTAMDPRMELYTKKMNGKYDYFDEYAKVTRGFIYYDDYFSKYDARYIVTSNAILGNMFEHDNRYTKLIDTDNYDLWIRE